MKISTIYFQNEQYYNILALPQCAVFTQEATVLIIGKYVKTMIQNAIAVTCVDTKTLCQ
jgi:rRNA processing protein Krr1/Pno1